jgi:hypothetical protein
VDLGAIDTASVRTTEKAGRTGIYTWQDRSTPPVCNGMKEEGMEGSIVPSVSVTQEPIRDPG